MLISAGILTETLKYEISAGFLPKAGEIFSHFPHLMSPFRGAGIIWVEWQTLGQKV